MKAKIIELMNKYPSMDRMRIESIVTVATIKFFEDVDWNRSINEIIKYWNLKIWGELSTDRENVRHKMVYITDEELETYE